MDWQRIQPTEAPSPSATSGGVEPNRATRWRRQRRPIPPLTPA